MTALAIQQRTPEWHAFRGEHITATDAAVIAGEKGSVVELWALKRGLVGEPEFDAETRALMDEGLAIQPYLIDFYTRRTGRRAVNLNDVRVSEDWPVASCSPDGEVIGENVGIEAKMTSSDRWPAAYRIGEPVPGDVFAQVQWQMYVTGWDRVDVVVLLFGRPKVIEIPRDPGYIADLVDLAHTFHEWVLSGERPPLDGSENARRVLAAQFPMNNGRLLSSTPDIDAVVRDLAMAKANAKQAADTAATLENTLRALIADADGVEGPWGKVTWKKNADSTRTNWPAVTKAYRSLLSDRPADELDAIESIHSETVTGPRVLRLALKEIA